MAKPSADLDTLQRVREVLALAMERGLDAAEALDRADLLLHRTRTLQITANMLYESADLVDQLTVKQVAGSERMPASPVDMKRQVASWMRARAAEFRGAAK